MSNTTTTAAAATETVDVTETVLNDLASLFVQTADTSEIIYAKARDIHRLTARPAEGGLGVKATAVIARIDAALIKAKREGKSLTAGALSQYKKAWKSVVDAGINTTATGSQKVVAAAYRATASKRTAAELETIIETVKALPANKRATAFTVAADAPKTPKVKAESNDTGKPATTVASNDVVSVLEHITATLANKSAAEMSTELVEAIGNAAFALSNAANAELARRDAEESAPVESVEVAELVAA